MFYSIVDQLQQMQPWWKMYDPKLFRKIWK